MIKEEELNNQREQADLDGAESSDSNFDEGDALEVEGEEIAQSRDDAEVSENLVETAVEKNAVETNLDA